MPLTSSLGEPSTSPDDLEAPSLVVVVPEGRASRRFWALVSLTARLDSHLVQPATVICWQTGPLAAAIRGGTAVDAGSVNAQRIPRALAAARLVGPARALKAWRLGRLLAPMTSGDQVLLGGASTLPLLDWLPPRPTRRVVVWLDDHDLDELDRVIALADTILAGGNRIAAALAERGVDPARWQRVAEPLLDQPASTAACTASGRRLVVLVGAADAIADGVAGVIAGAASGGPDGTALVWLHPDRRRRDERWSDPRFAGLEGQLADLTIDDSPLRLDEVAAIVSFGPTPVAGDDDLPTTGAVEDVRPSLSRLAITAALAGIPVIGRGADESVAVEVADAAALQHHLAALLTDPSSWAAASAASVDRAQPHRLDLAEVAVVEALGLDGT